MKVLVAYDGTLQSKDALKYGVQQVREHGGEVVALHVFNSNMFIDYDAHPGAEEMARAESSRYVEDAKRLIAETGSDVNARIMIEEGVPAEEIIRYARIKNVDILLCPPRYKSIIERYKKLLKREGKTSREDSILDESDRLKMTVVTAR